MPFQKEVESVTAGVQLVSAFITRAAAMVTRSPSGAIVLFGGCLLPRIYPLAVGGTIYWAAWWTLLVCWGVGGTAEPTSNTASPSRCGPTGRNRQSASHADGSVHASFRRGSSCRPFPRRVCRFQ